MSEAENIHPSGDPADIDIAKIDVSRAELFEHEQVLPLFERLRREDPVHYCPESRYGPYWSVTRHKDIMTVDTSHKIYSSDVKYGGIIIDDGIQNDPEHDLELPNFIACDQPKHWPQRRAVQPIAAPPNIEAMEGQVRERTSNLLDSLPVNEDFDWVKAVSIELTTRFLATIFDFPFEDRAKLTRWSDVATAGPDSGIIENQAARIKEMMECLEYFTRLQKERGNRPPTFDLVSMMAHDETMKNQTPQQYLGNLLLLIVGGNDTTRNSMSGSVYGLNQFPEQYQRLRDDHSLIEPMVSEAIRWQTPLSHMRRTALADAELGGKKIKKGDKVVMWYYSGNRDEDVFPDGDKFIIGRDNRRQHLSFGFGIHRCMGLRLGELQLRILWEEILKRWETIEVVQKPKRVRNNFVNGYSEMMVRIKA